MTKKKRLPKITVIVPTFNDGEMLIQALESIRNQTFTDFEVIVGDDCSTNNTAQLATEFCMQDDRFRVEASPENVGMTRNWNRTMALAAGKYVCKLDGDDFYQPRTLELLHEELRRREARIAFCRTIDCDQDLMPQGSYYGERALIRSMIEPADNHVRSGGQWYSLCFNGCQLWHSNAFLIETDVFQQLGGWDHRWGCAADTDVILRLLELNEPVCSISYPGVLYRRRPGSILDTFSKRSWRRIETNAVLLLSLARANAQGLLTPSLKYRWAWIWSDQQKQLAGVAGNEQNFRDLDAAHVEIPLPPCIYRIAFRSYDFLSQLKRRLQSPFRGQNVHE